MDRLYHPDPMMRGMDTGYDLIRQAAKATSDLIAEQVKEQLAGLTASLGDQPKLIMLNGQLVNMLVRKDEIIVNLQNRIDKLETDAVRLKELAFSPRKIVNQYTGKEISDELVQRICREAELEGQVKGQGVTIEQINAICKAAKECE